MAAGAGVAAARGEGRVPALLELGVIVGVGLSVVLTLDGLRAIDIVRLPTVILRPIRGGLTQVVVGGVDEVAASRLDTRRATTATCSASEPMAGFPPTVASQKEAALRAPARRGGLLGDEAAGFSVTEGLEVDGELEAVAMPSMVGGERAGRLAEMTFASAM